MVPILLSIEQFLPWLINVIENNNDNRPQTALFYIPAECGQIISISGIYNDNIYSNRVENGEGLSFT